MKRAPTTTLFVAASITLSLTVCDFARGDACAEPPVGLNHPGFNCFAVDPGELGERASVVVDNGTGTVNTIRNGAALIQMLVPIEDKRILITDHVSYTAVLQWETPRPVEDLLVREVVVTLPRGITSKRSDRDKDAIRWILNEEELATGWISEFDVFANAPKGAQMDHIHTVTQGLAEDDEVRFSFSMVGGTVIDQVDPDLNGDGSVTAADFDELANAIRNDAYDLRYDFKGDGKLDDQEFRSMAWYNLTWQGDANLDGKVSFADFVALSNHYGTEAGWAGGNFTSDEIVGFEDFILLSNHFGRGDDPVAATVPEPRGFMLFSWILLLACFMRRNLCRYGW